MLVGVDKPVLADMFVDVGMIVAVDILGGVNMVDAVNRSAILVEHMLDEPDLVDIEATWA